MAASTAPQIEHTFDGDAKLLNGTADTRSELRKALTAFQSEVARLLNAPVQVQADIKLRIASQPAKQNVYAVTLTSSTFDPEAFQRQLPSTTDKSVNGQHANAVQSTPRPSSQKGTDDDDVIEIRPFKRPRTSAASASPSQSQSQPAGDSGEITQLNQFLREWHTEWTRQGGWLFDNITNITSIAAKHRAGLEQKLDAVQDVLGHSMNSASASTMTELGNISKLIPWLEECRKVNADKSQAREEKWRTSSANFHDQNSKDRETAEKRIEKKLEEQKELLLKLAKATGVDDIDGQEEEDVMASREESRFLCLYRRSERQLIRAFLQVLELNLPPS
jgi:hypothetical protein